MTLLSICIATFNRANLVEKLVNSLLEIPGDFEVVVHVDGSPDRSEEILRSIRSDRLIVSSASENHGKIASLKKALALSSGKFAMFFGDDDLLTKEGLEIILRDCSELSEEFGGLVYHMLDESGDIVGSVFPTQVSNLIAIRADFGVKGDKREIFRTADMMVAMQRGRLYWRVPTSLFWTRISLHREFVFVNKSVGVIRYQEAGISRNLSKIKRRYPYPMYLLHKERFLAFFFKRYKSKVFLGRSAAGMIYYGLICAFQIVVNSSGK